MAENTNNNKNYYTVTLQSYNEVTKRFHPSKVKVGSSTISFGLDSEILNMVNNKIVVDVLKPFGLNFTLTPQGISFDPITDNINSDTIYFPKESLEKLKRVVRNQASIYYSSNLTDDIIDDVTKKVLRIIGLSNFVYSIVLTTKRTFDSANVKANNINLNSFLNSQGSEPFTVTKLSKQIQNVGQAAEQNPYAELDIKGDPYEPTSRNNVTFGLGNVSNAVWARWIERCSNIYLSLSNRRLLELMFANYFAISSKDTAYNLVTLFPHAHATPIGDVSNNTMDLAWETMKNITELAITMIEKYLNEYAYMAEILDAIGMKWGINVNLTRDLNGLSMSIIHDNDNDELRRVFASAINNKFFNSYSQFLGTADSSAYENIIYGDDYLMYPSDVSYELDNAKSAVFSSFESIPLLSIPIDGSLGMYLQSNVVHSSIAVIIKKVTTTSTGIATNSYLARDYLVDPNTYLELDDQSIEQIINDSQLLFPKYDLVVTRWNQALSLLRGGDPLYSDKIIPYILRFTIDDNDNVTYDYLANDARMMNTLDIDDYYVNQGNVPIIVNETNLNLIMPDLNSIKINPVNNIVVSSEFYTNKVKQDKMRYSRNNNNNKNNDK